MQLNSIDTNRLKRNLSIVMKEVENNNTPVIITRHRSPFAIMFPMHYNTQTEAWAVRGHTLRPSQYRGDISVIARRMMEIEGPRIIAIVVKPFKNMQHSVVVIEFEVAKKIVKFTSYSDNHYKPLPFSDNRPADKWSKGYGFK